jgi:hypothetical protein
MGLSVNRYSLIVLLAPTLVYSCGQNSGGKVSRDFDEKETSDNIGIFLESIEKDMDSRNAHIFEIDSLDFEGTYKVRDFVVNVSSIDSTFFNSVSGGLEANLEVEEVDLILTKDSCFVLEYNNDEEDTICNINNKETGYFQKYELDGVWRNHYVVSYQDWESSDTYLINKDDSKKYTLGSGYSVQQDTLIFYNSEVYNPLASNYLGFSSVSMEGIQPIVTFDFLIYNPVLIKKDNKGYLLKAAILSERNFKVSNYQYFKIRFSNK